LLTQLNSEVNDRRNSDTNRGELADGREHFPVHRICVFVLSEADVRQVRQTNEQSGYFFSAGAVAAVGGLGFHISAAHFQLPSGCFSQTSRYLPLSLACLPLGSFNVSSYVPLTQAISPDLPSCTLDGFQLIRRPGVARTSFHTLRIVSFVAALVA